MKITDFLKTTRNKEDLRAALETIREFKSCEGEHEWVDIPWLAWAKLEQLEEFLEYLVNGKELKHDTKSYMKDF